MTRCTQRCAPPAPDLAPAVLRVLRSRCSELPATALAAASVDPALCATLTWAELGDLLFAERRWAPVIADAVESLCAPEVVAAHALLANGFNGTLAELADTLTGITTEPAT